MTIDKNSSTPIFQQLENLIEGWIKSGKLPPGSRIPSEAELAQSYQISRVTVRHALDRLAMEGAIYRKQGKGAYVSPGKVNFNPATIFSFSQAMRALGHRVETRVLDQRLAPAPPGVAQDLNLPGNSPLVLVSRLRFVDDLPATIHRSYLPIQYYQAILKVDLTSEPLSDVMGRLSGLAIAYTRDSFEAALVHADEAFLSASRKKRPSCWSAGTFTSSGLPIRATRSVYHGDLFRFQVSPGKGLEVHFQAANAREVTYQ